MDIKNDIDELDKIELLEKGINEGLRLKSEDMECFIRPILMELYQQMSENDESDAFNMAIYLITYIYAYIFGDQHYFELQYDRGRLLTVPELRFGRLADPSERQLPLEELDKIWEDEAEKKNK